MEWLDLFLPHSYYLTRFQAFYSSGGGVFLCCWIMWMTFYFLLLISFVHGCFSAYKWGFFLDPFILTVNSIPLAWRMCWDGGVAVLFFRTFSNLHLFQTQFMLIRFSPLEFVLFTPTQSVIFIHSLKVLAKLIDR